MPFPEGAPAMLKGLYGVIEQSVTARRSTAETWDAIRRAAGGNLTGLGFRGAQAVSSLRGIAAQVRNAEERLAKEAHDAALDYRHLGVPPWARGDALRAATPQYVARAELMVSNPLFLEGMPGEPEFLSQWFSVNMSSLPATAGDLRNKVIEAALGKPIGRGQPGTPLIGAVGGIGRLQLLTV